jgi:hypothetical protein
VLAKNPGHPGANHYYIHAVEASPHPERALRAADTVAATMPAAGHIVHMPSHIYMRVGRYADAADTNTNAIKVDEAYIAAQQPNGVYPMMYYPHNVHFFWSAASMEGRSADAIAAARGLDKQIEPTMLAQMPPMEYFAPTLEFSLVRFGKWDEILAVPKPPRRPRLLARDVAPRARPRARRDGQARRGRRVARRATAARGHRAGRPHHRGQPAGCAAPRDRREGARRRDRRAPRAHRRGIVLLQEGVAAEDALPYTEPPPWYQPVRHRLGAVLLKHGRSAEARPSIARTCGTIATTDGRSPGSARRSGARASATSWRRPTCVATVRWRGPT